MTQSEGRPVDPPLDVFVHQVSPPELLYLLLQLFSQSGFGSLTVLTAAGLRDGFQSVLNIRAGLARCYISCVQLKAFRTFRGTFRALCRLQNVAFSDTIMAYPTPELPPPPLPPPPPQISVYNRFLSEYCDL